jgi:hypothetical protein
MNVGMADVADWNLVSRHICPAMLQLNHVMGVVSSATTTHNTHRSDIFFVPRLA